MARPLDVHAIVLREWARPTWAGPRRQHPLAPPPRRPASNTPVINQPHIDDPEEEWARWLWHHAHQSHRFPGIRYMATGMDLRTIRGHQLVGRYSPKGDDGRMSYRLAFQRAAILMIAQPGRYQQVCAANGWVPASTVTRGRFPPDRQGGVTEDTVAEWFAQSGVPFSSVDDAWTFATGWLEDQRAREGPRRAQAQTDWEWLMATQTPLNDPIRGPMMQPWYPPADDPVPGAAPRTPPPTYTAGAEAGEAPAFTDYNPSRRPNDWATDVEATLASGQPEVRLHVAGSGLHRPPPRPVTPAEDSGDVEMDAGDSVDQEDAVSFGTRVTSPDNAWSDGCFD
jgi:hypothetical protein